MFFYKEKVWRREKEIERKEEKEERKGGREG